MRALGAVDELLRYWSDVQIINDGTSVLRDILDDVACCSEQLVVACSLEAQAKGDFEAPKNPIALENGDPAEQ